MLKGLHHVAIICSNFERSKRFYTHVLGLKIIKETYRAARGSFKLDLALGDTYIIELFSFPNPPVRISRPEACGLRHIAFAVENMDEEIQRLQQHGVQLEAVRFDELTGKRFTFFSDPDDLPIELYEI